MTNHSYEMTRALVAERQDTLHHEARRYRLGLRGRPSRLRRWASDLQNPPPSGSGPRETLFG